MLQLPQLSPDTPTPLYQQLKAWIVASIRSGSWPPHTPLPSERTLTRELGVSRATVRQAIDDLEHEGWVVRRQGRGTFIAPSEIERPAAQPGGFSDRMRRAGHTPSSKLLSAQLEEPDDATARALDLIPGQVVAAITHLRLADGEPLLVERSHLPAHLVPRLLDQDLAGSLYQLLTDRYRLDLHHGEESLQISKAGGWVAKALGIKKKRPVLYTERIVRSGDGVAIEFAQRYARTDRCRFRVKLERGGWGADFDVR